MWQSTENNKMRGTSQLGFLDRVLVVVIVLNAVLWNALDLCAVGPAVGDRRSRSIRSPSSRLQCQRRNGAWFNSASVHVAASRAAFVPQHVLIQIGGKSKFEVESLHSRNTRKASVIFREKARVFISCYRNFHLRKPPKKG